MVVIHKRKHRMEEEEEKEAAFHHLLLLLFLFLLLCDVYTHDSPLADHSMCVGTHSTLKKWKQTAIERRTAVKNTFVGG